MYHLSLGIIHHTKKYQDAERAASTPVRQMHLGHVQCLEGPMCSSTRRIIVIDDMILTDVIRAKKDQMLDNI